MRRFKWWAGIALVITGICLVAYPFYQEWQQNHELAELDDALAMVDQSDEDAFEVADRTFTKEQLAQVYELVIPSIDLNQKVLGETTEENLSMSLTQIKEDQVPGKGNFTIAGHRGYRGDRHFRELPDVEIGDEVHLTANGETFIYEIASSEVIAPTAVDILEDEKNHEEITMITCTIGGQQRIAVQGNLVDVVEQ